MVPPNTARQTDLSGDIISKLPYSVILNRIRRDVPGSVVKFTRHSRESGNSGAAADTVFCSLSAWIPAFAGMTGLKIHYQHTLRIPPALPLDKNSSIFKVSDCPANCVASSSTGIAEARNFRI